MNDREWVQQKLRETDEKYWVAHRAQNVWKGYAFLGGIALLLAIKLAYFMAWF